MAQAKSLPMPQRAAPIFTKAGPMPRRPQGGAKAGAWGTAAKEVGGHIQEYGQYRDKMAQAQGKADMAAQTQNAKLKQMIEKRRLAMRIQAAKERWQNTVHDFKVLEEKRDRVQREEQAEVHKWRGEDRTTKAGKQKQVTDFYKEFRKEEEKASQQGKKMTGQDAEEIASLFGVQGDRTVNTFIRRRFPKYRPGGTAGDRGRANKQQIAAHMVPYLEDEVVILLDKLKEVTGAKYESSRLIYNTMTLEREIHKVVKESEQRADVLGLEKEIRKKVAELHKAKAVAKEPLPAGGTSDLIDRVEALEAENEELDKALQGK